MRVVQEALDGCIIASDAMALDSSLPRSGLEFASDEDLLDRLSARPHGLVYLVGSAVTAPSRMGEPGVPLVGGVIELIRGQHWRPTERDELDRILAAEPDNRYQAAFRFLLRKRDQDVANEVIRQAVLLARRPSRRFPTVPAWVENHDHCRSLEDDMEGWHLPPAVEALGRVLAHTSASTRPVVLTSNFDPLVAISVRRAGGYAYTTALHGDGSLSGVDGQGCLVVHLHGDWFRTDTLHTPAQLGQDRPKLSASLAQLISERTLVVLGYSGWDDVFTRSLIATIRGGLAPIKIAWAFYSGDETAIVRGSTRLLEALRPGIDMGRVGLYKGIDAHTFLPLLAMRLAERTEAGGAPSMIASGASTEQNWPSTDGQSAAQTSTLSPLHDQPLAGLGAQEPQKTAHLSERSARYALPAESFPGRDPALHSAPVRLGLDRTGLSLATQHSIDGRPSHVEALGDLLVGLPVLCAGLNNADPKVERNWRGHALQEHMSAFAQAGSAVSCETLIQSQRIKA